MRVAVAGGTGTVGRHTVTALHALGHQPVVIARSTGVDVATGRGLEAALAGVDAVIDVTSVATIRAAASIAFFRAATTHLLAAASRAGVGHHVALSIVGVDRAPHAYYAGKAVQEGLVEAAPVPWTILRTTQFHEFAAQMFGTVRVGPLHLAPRMRTQPVAAREVAARLAELAVAGPAGRVPDLAGPREEELSDMVRAYARARGVRGPVPRVSLPGAFGRAQRDGSLLPGPGVERGSQSFAQWLAAAR